MTPAVPQYIIAQLGNTHPGSLAYLQQGYIMRYPVQRPAWFDDIPDLTQAHATPALGAEGQPKEITDHLAIGRISFQNLIEAELTSCQYPTHEAVVETANELYDGCSDAYTASPTGERYQESVWLRALHNVLYGNRREGMVDARYSRRLGHRIDNTGDITGPKPLGAMGKLRTRTLAPMRASGVLLVGNILGAVPGSSTRRRQAALKVAETVIAGPRRARQLSKH